MGQSPTDGRATGMLMGNRIESIFHPSDFSEASEVAFAHALKLALAAQAELSMLHATDGSDAEWQYFPGVREILERWKLIPEGTRRTRYRSRRTADHQPRTGRGHGHAAARRGRKRHARAGNSRAHGLELATLGKKRRSGANHPTRRGRAERGLDRDDDGRAGWISRRPARHHLGAGAGQGPLPGGLPTSGQPARLSSLYSDLPVNVPVPVTGTG